MTVPFTVMPDVPTAMPQLSFEGIGQEVWFHQPAVIGASDHQNRWAVLPIPSLEEMRRRMGGREAPLPTRPAGSRTPNPPRERPPDAFLVAQARLIKDAR